jgi:hypothetical protein
VADVIAAVGFPWLPAVVMVFAIASVPANVVVLTVDDVPGAPAGAQVSAASTTSTAINLSFCYCCS